MTRAGKKARLSKLSRENWMLRRDFPGLSVCTGKNCIFGHLGLVFIWSCFLLRYLQKEPIFCIQFCSRDEEKGLSLLPIFLRPVRAKTSSKLSVYTTRTNRSVWVKWYPDFAYFWGNEEKCLEVKLKERLGQTGLLDCSSRVLSASLPLQGLTLVLCWILKWVLKERIT